MSTMTQQDLFTISEVTKNKILDRLVTKYDVQLACDSARDKVISAIQSMHLENQAALRQANAQKDQSWRKLTELENEMSALKRELRIMNRLLARFTEDEPVNQASVFSSLPVK